MNRYWIPRLDIHKSIIVQQLPYFLGPEATVRAYTNEVWRAVESTGKASLTIYQGEDGFLITTPGPCLTDVSLDVAPFHYSETPSP